MTIGAMETAVATALPEHAGQRTIFALASGSARAAIAVVRISGAASGRILDALCRSRPIPRVASLRTLRNEDGDVLDKAVVLWLPGPGTYTGEDSAELQLHGGRAVIAGVSDALTALGAWPAEPGEFTRRAFMNGRLDLIEAEAVADLVDAETSAQRRQALRQLEGGLSRLYGDWAERLRHVLAWQEATIDFPDEDLPEELDQRVRNELTGLRADILRHLDDGRRGERLREGLVCVFTGAPNVGKSSLINAIAGRDIAIVSPVPGTTRDALEARVELGGVPVTLIDTAGLRQTHDAIELEGVRRARKRIETADLVVAVRDATQPQQMEEFAAPEGARILHVANKVDLAPAPADMIAVSALTGFGLDRLRQELDEAVRTALPGADAPPLTRARHRAALSAAADSLAAALAAEYADQRAEDLRLAMQSIGTITGHVGVEDILGTIFASFCIGK